MPDIRDEPLERALACLGKLSDDEQQQAREAIGYNVEAYHRAKKRYDNSPRRQQIRDLLSEIQKLEASLSEKLDAIAPYLSQIAGLSGFDHYFQHDILLKLGDTQDALADFMLKINSVREVINERWQDKGGRGKFIVIFEGMPKWQIVQSCWGIFAEFNRNPLATSDSHTRPTSTESGPFQQFCEAVFELAEGIERAHEGAGLDRYIKAACRSMSGISEVNKKMNRLRRLREIRDWSDEERAEYERLVEELRKIPVEYPL